MGRGLGASPIDCGWFVVESAYCAVELSWCLPAWPAASGRQSMVGGDDVLQPAAHQVWQLAADHGRQPAANHVR